MSRAKISQKNKLLSELNEDQQKVVVATQGPVLVLAGAGSGKTRALTYRIAYMIQQGIARPEEILAVTFTNKAAGEMKERVAQLLGDAYTVPRSISTFHSLGATMLREQASFLPRTRGFTICDSDDSERVVRLVMDELGFSKKEHSPKKLRHRISSEKNLGRKPADVAAQLSSAEDEVLAQVFARYEKLLARNDAYDFDDLIIRPLELLERQRAVRDNYRARWRYISVDEYQDTNPLQDRLLQLLLNKEQNLCAVGDDYQAIYSWRGARVDHILTFDKRFPDCTTIYLTRNYRSTPAILEAANKVIAENKDQKHKELWTKTQVGNPVTVQSFMSNQDEARWVRSSVEDYVTGGGKRRECVVLYRTNAQSRALEEEFLTHRIPYTIVGGFRFYDRREVKDALALLQWWVNPSSTLALRRLADALWRGIGPKTIARWELRAEQHDTPLRTLLTQPDIARPVMSPLLGAYEDAKDKEFATVADLLAHLIMSSGYEKWLKKQPDGDERWENIEELLTVTGAFSDPLQFLEEAALLSDIDTLEEEQDRVTCMTLHASKGLEFPVVVVVGLEEGLLPHENSYDSRASMEEERRLLYVGMTRAQENLTLTYAQTRYLHGDVTSRTPSRFLTSLPDTVEHHTEVRSRDTEQPKTIDDFNLLLDDDSEPVITSYEEGDFISHPKFGRGVVVEIKGATVMCVFEGAGVKVISADEQISNA